jgi:hypothetical protein
MNHWFENLFNFSTEYKCGSDEEWSEVFKFKAIKSDNFSPRLAVFGDLGHENGRSIPQLKTDVKNGLYDAILHIGWHFCINLIYLDIVQIILLILILFISGDIAYDLDKVSLFLINFFNSLINYYMDSWKLSIRCSTIKI